MTGADESASLIVYGKSDISQSLRSAKRVEMKLVREMVEYASLKSIFS
jgi:hypothetical protein